MGDFAAVLSRVMDRPVVDKTGLTGVYDFVLEFVREDSRTMQAESPTVPSIFTALQEKLGLKLEAKKRPVEILVIDREEKVPVEN